MVKKKQDKEMSFSEGIQYMHRRHPYTPSQTEQMGLWRELVYGPSQEFNEKIIRPQKDADEETE